MKASDFIVDSIARAGTDKIFGYIGGMITHLADSVYRSGKVEFVDMISEQGAAFAAEGYARISYKTGVAIATSGPGATNLLTGVGSCYFDSVAVVFITGQVNTYEYKGNLPVRQRGFQETDIISMARPIVKYCAFVDKAENLRYELEKAFFLASWGRRGPTLLDIPMDVQRADIDFEKQRAFIGSREHANLASHPFPKNSEVKKIAAALAKAERPVILAGGGIRGANACELLEKFSQKNRIPVVQSLMGRDSLSASTINLGLIGIYGNRNANFALANADFILTLGSRLDSRQTGTSAKLFGRCARIVLVDIDENELSNSRIHADITVHADAGKFLEAIYAYDCRRPRSEWFSYLSKCAADFPSEFGIDQKLKVGNAFVKKLSEAAAEACCVFADVGQHQMWVAQSFSIAKGQRLIFSGGMGAMGFALPAAIGAATATSGTVVAICGDGGLQMNIQELEVIKRRNLSVKIFVLNNSCLGMVKQFQEMYFGGRCIGTIVDYSAPDFVKIGRAYGLKSSRIKAICKKNVIAKFFADNTAQIVDVSIGRDCDVEPKLLMNRPIEDMTPYLPREKFLEFMLIKPAEESLDG